MRRLLRLLENRDLDGCVIAHPPNLRYLFGFSGSEALALCLDGEVSLMVDSRYEEQAQTETSGVRAVLAVSSPEETLKQAIRRKCKPSRSRIAFEANHATHLWARRVTESNPECTWVAAEELVEQLRLVKDETEIQLLSTAFQRSQRALNKALDRFRSGISEQEAAGLLELEMRRAGGDGTAFDTIVASGPRSSLPHGVATGRSLRQNELVLVDFGMRYQGYVSDLTRVFFPERTARPEIYSIVQDAQRAALQAVIPGKSSEEVDRAARSVIDRHGYGDFFGHGTGHGLGLEVHERPRISKVRPEELRPGMVFTVEPGIYLPGRYGIRIEDAVLVTESGYRLLSEPQQ